MKRYLKNKFYGFLKTKYAVFLKKIVAQLNHHIQKEQEESKKIFKAIMDKKIVVSGIFKGMKYPELSSFGSALYPKILGSYETELSSTIERLLKKNYKEIIDIGCAEGYYIVGLALKTSAETTIWGFDIDKTALAMCQKMAVENLIQNKIILGNLFRAEDLAKFKFTNGLVLCDCEGCENELFTPESINNMRNCDAIIELHDFKIPGIQKKLVNLFSSSHECQVIKTNNWYKHVTRNPKEYKYILKGINYEIKIAALDEYRPGPMKWLVLERKK